MYHVTEAKSNALKQAPKQEKDSEESANVRQVAQARSSLFFQYNTQL